MKSSQRSNIIPLASTANDTFFPGLLVALGTALLCASGQYDYRVIVFDGGLQANQWATLEAVLTKIAATKAIGVSLEKIATADSVFAQFPAWRGSPLPWARLTLPHLFDEPCFVYLDGDVLCFQGVEALWEAMTPTVPLVAVRDPKKLGREGNTMENDSTTRQLLSGKNLKQPYFNSGVMALNCTYFRQHNYWEQAMELLKGDIKFRMADQSLLNFLYVGQWQEISDLNNLMLTTINAPRVVEARQPLNIHFSGSGLKPWLQPQSQTRRYIADCLWDMAYRHLLFPEVPETSPRALDADSLAKARRKARLYRLLAPSRSRLYQSAIQQALGAEVLLRSGDFLASLSQKFPKPLEPLP